MKVVILAGGLGSRLSEYTKKIPKPMVKIRKVPIILHIMKHYANFGFKDFYIAAGYKQNGFATLTAVRPPARFGAIKINGKKVVYFKEKSKLDEGWINGGFFVFEPEIFKYLKRDSTFLEKEPLSILGKQKKLNAYKHNGFWHCMDTIRDKEILEKNLQDYKKI